MDLLSTESNDSGTVTGRGDPRGPVRYSVRETPQGWVCTPAASGQGSCLLPTPGGVLGVYVGCCGVPSPGPVHWVLSPHLWGPVAHRAVVTGETCGEAGWAAGRATAGPFAPFEWASGTVVDVARHCVVKTKATEVGRDVSRGSWVSAKGDVGRSVGPTRPAIREPVRRGSEVKTFGDGGEHASFEGRKEGVRRFRVGGKSALSFSNSELRSFRLWWRFGGKCTWSHGPYSEGRGRTRPKIQEGARRVHPTLRNVPTNQGRPESTRRSPVLQGALLSRVTPTVLRG